MAGRSLSVWAAAGLAILTGCGVEPGKACPAVGVRVGVGLEVEPPLAATVDHATLTACWDAGCRNHTVDLEQVTAAGSQTCSGDTCHASVAPTEAIGGFADIVGLPKKPVRMRVVLHGTEGKRVFDQRLTVTPKGILPGGPECGEGGPQVHLVVADGRLRAPA